MAKAAEPLFTALDADGDGSLSLKELENMLLDDQSNPCTKEQCRELFESFDDDDNGEISLDEFKTGIKMFLGIQNEKMQAGGCARETLHLEKPRGVSKEPPSPSDIVLVYTQRGEHMVPKLAEALDAKRQQVYMLPSSRNNCAGIAELEAQIVGAKLGVVLFVTNDLKASLVPFAMRCVLKYRKTFTLVHAAELCRFDEVMPDDSFNDVSELYSKIAISYIAMYNQADSTAILDDLTRQEKQRRLESEDEEREAARGAGTDQVMSEARDASGKMKAERGEPSACEVGHMSTCQAVTDKEAKALAELLESAPPHMKELQLRFRIFLSHRRATGQGIAGRIFEKFGREYCTFLDSEATFELHNLQMLIEKTNVIVFILTEGILNKSLFCLLELLTAIHHQKEVVLVRDLSYHLPMEPGQIAALCLPVLLGKMVRIKACGEQFTDEHAAARAIEKKLLDEASSRMIIYHAEHFASFADAMRRRLGISDPMALELRQNERKQVYSSRIPTCPGTFCFCLRTATHIQFSGMELDEPQGILLAELLPDSVEQIHLDGCGLGVPSARAFANTVRRAKKLRVVNLARDENGFPLELQDIRSDEIFEGKLNLSSRRLFDADVIVLLAALPPKSKIVSLDLSGNSLSALAAEAIAEAMPCLPALCDLNLSKNYIGDEGLLKLLGICGCVREACPLPASLQSLNLRDNNIGGRGAIKLAEVLKSGSMPAAAAIDLSHNWVDSPAAQSIARMQAAFPPSLRHFGLWKNMMCDDDATCRLFKDGKCKLEPPEHEHGMYAPPSSLVDLLGPKLIRGVGKEQQVIETTSLTNKVVMIYFGAAWCGPCNTFTSRAKANGWYQELLEAQSPVEMIYVSSDRDEYGFEHYYKSHPWLALPFEARDVKARLSSKYGVEGIPTLVLLRSDCSLITKEGRRVIEQRRFRQTGDAEEFQEDETGPNITEAICSMAERDASFRFLKPSDKCSGVGSLHPAEVLQGLDCYAIYHSAHWCPHCPPMTKAMTDGVYKQAKAQGLKFEIIFISGDEDQESYDRYRMTMPWLAFNHESGPAEMISRMLGFRAFPQMALIGKDGFLKSMKGCATVRGDPKCENFPWDPQPVYQLKHATDEWDEKPTLLVLQEAAPPSRQRETMEALKPLSERFMASVKEGFSKFDILFTVANDDEHGVVKAARKMIGCDPSDKATRTVILNLHTRNPAFYAHEGEVSTSAIACFLQAFMAGALQKQPLRGGQ